jgi:hypothetical protein
MRDSSNHSADIAGAGTPAGVVATATGCGSSARGGGEFGGTPAAPEARVAGVSSLVNSPPAASCAPGVLFEGTRTPATRHPDWDDATIQTVRQWAAAGVSQREMALRLGMAQFAVAQRMAFAGIETLIRKPRSGEMVRAAAVLVEQFATHPDLKALLVVYRQARGTDAPTMKTMRTHARKLRLVRPNDTPAHAAKRGGATTKAKAAADDAALAPRLQASVNETYSLAASAAALGCSYKRARRMVRQGMVVVPAKPKAPKVVQVKPPPAPRKPNKLPKSWVRDTTPLPPKPRTQTVADFLAAGGQITRCPAAAAFATTANMGEGREVIRAHALAMEGDDGNWKQRAKRKMGRFHFGVGASA